MSTAGHDEGWQALSLAGGVQATAENSASSESRAQSLLSSVVQISRWATCRGSLAWGCVSRHLLWRFTRW